MSKSNRKSARPNKNITDFFSRSSTAPSSSPLRAPHSSPVARPNATKPRRNNAPPGPDQEIISLSSGTRSHRSHISISDQSSKSHITISSGPPPEGPSHISIHTTPSPIKLKAPATSIVDLTAPSAGPSRIPGLRSATPAKTPSTPSRARLMFDAVELTSPFRTPASSRPTSFYGERPVSPSKVPAAAKRKKKFETDSESDVPAGIVTLKVNTPSRVLAPKENLDLASPRSSPSAPKKRRLDKGKEKTDAGADAHDRDSRVPSSQSDEHELTIPRSYLKPPAAVRETVETWRRSMSVQSVQPGLVDDLPTWDDDLSMDVDAPAGGESGRASGASEMEINEHLASSSVLSSPPPSSPVLAPTVPDPATPKREQASDAWALTPLTPMTPMTPKTAPDATLQKTPVTLDSKAKTAQLIEEIRRRAYEQGSDSGSSEPGVLGAAAESSDESDDEFFAQAFAKPTKTSAKGKARASPDSTPSAGETSANTSRYSLRNQTPTTAATSVSASSVGPSTCRRPARNAAKPALIPTPLTAAVTKGKGKARISNPLDTLLREKQRADAAGRGTEARGRAERAAKQDMMREVDGEEADEEEGEGEWDERQAALRAARAAVARGGGAGDVDVDVDEGEMRLDAEALRRMHVKDGEVVGRILENDRRMDAGERGRLERKEKEVGVALWRSTVLVAQPAPARDLPVLDIGEGVRVHPIVQRLVVYANANDANELVRFLDLGLLYRVEDEASLAAVTPWLIANALMPPWTPVSSHALVALRQITASGSPSKPTPLAFATVLLFLQRLGMKDEAFASMEWQALAEPPVEGIDLSTRLDAIWRLTAVITAFASGGYIVRQDIPDMFIALAMIALDPMSDADLQAGFSASFDALCTCVEEAEDADGLERAVCLKVFELGSTLSPVNRSLLFRQLTGGSPVLGRITRWVAYGLLAGGLASYSPQELPDLSVLGRLLDPSSATDSDMAETPNVFALTERTDYEDLGFHMDVLSAALVGIDDYVDAERLDKTRAGALEDVRDALIKMHAAIKDTKAAHLDRSRAKAAIQRLAMRVNYGRESALNYAPGTGLRRPRNIREAFAKKNALG